MFLVVAADARNYQPTKNELKLEHHDSHQATGRSVPDGMVPISSNQPDEHAIEEMKEGTLKDHNTGEDYGTEPKTQQLSDEVRVQ